jgi:Arc/MetJ family transcription regulator
MRTNIDIDDKLMAEAMAASGLSTKKATVEEALKLMLLRKSRMKALENMAGTGWVGNLDVTREGRFFE